MVKAFVKRHPSSWRYISVIGILSLVFPVIFITYFAGEVGKFIGMAVYMLLGFFAMREISRAVKVSKISCIFLSLLPMVMFAFPYDPLKQINDAITHNVIFDAETFFNWKPIVVIALSTFVVLLDPKLRVPTGKANMSVKFLIIFISLLIISCFTKIAWIINMAHYGKFIFVVSIAIVADSFAYLGGKYFGKKIMNGKKLAPKISPKKTWGGFIIGSVLASLFIGLVGYYTKTFEHGNSTYTIVIVSLLSIFLPIISAFGDLMFSAFKRLLGVKDFSNLIPGHGGIMDRLDAISIVMTTIAIIFMIFNI